MKSICLLVSGTLLLVAASAAQNPPAQNPPTAAPAARTDLYHVHFAKAALGKGAEEGDYLKKPDPKAPMPGHFLVLRHQEGADWDYVVVEHLGTKTTLEAAGNLTPAGVRDLNAWHTDTYVNGPAWAEFARALGIDPASTAKTASSVYTVSVFRAAPGHRDELEKAISQPPGGGVAGSVLMQHLEGAAWNFLTIDRYNSWEDFATSQKAAAAETLKPGGGWLQVRDHSSFHNDTITDRIAP